MQAKETFVTGETVGCLNNGERCYVVVIAVDGEEVTVCDYWNHWKMTYKPRTSDGYHVAPGYEDVNDLPNMIYQSESALNAPLVKDSRNESSPLRATALSWFRKLNPKSA